MVIYSGNSSEDSIATRIRAALYKNLRKISSNLRKMSLPPDSDSLIQVIKRAHLQAYIWYKADQPVIGHLNFEENGWKNENSEITPLWSIGKQLPPFHRRKQRK